MITVYQSDGTTVTPLADGKLYEFLSGGTVGVILGCEVTSLGGLQLQIASGWILIKGRIIAIQQETISVTSSTSGEVDGRLLLHLDVSSDESPGIWVTQAQTPLPELVQEDINGSGTIYEMPLAQYKVDQLSVSGLQNIAPQTFSPPSFMYKATFLVDGWSGDGPYTQTVSVQAVDGGPVITSASHMTSGLFCDDTVQGDAQETMLEAAALVDKGKKTFGSGTITCVLENEKPEADAEVYFNAKKGGT